MRGAVKHCGPSPHPLHSLDVALSGNLSRLRFTGPMLMPSMVDTVRDGSLEVHRPVS